MAQANPGPPEFWYAVRCLDHGRQNLSMAQYNAMLDAPDQTWRCPICRNAAAWDGDCDA